MADDRTRPDLEDATVEALGRLSEALEVVEHARGLLYGFHRLTGTADEAARAHAQSSRPPSRPGAHGRRQRPGTRHTRTVTTPDPTARPVTPSSPPAGISAPGSPGTGRPPVTPATSAARPGAPAPAPPRRRTRRVGLTLAAMLLVFVTVVLVLFVIFNTQSVRISLVFGDVDAPLVLALALAAVLGGLVVGLWSLVRRSRRSGR